MSDLASGIIIGIGIFVGIVVIAIFALWLRDRKGDLPAGTFLIGQANPEVVPAGLTEALGWFYASRADVRAAYLGMMKNVSAGTPAEIVIALDTTSNLYSLAEQSRQVLLGLPRTGFGLCIIDANDEIGKQLKKKVLPFYSREGHNPIG